MSNDLELELPLVSKRLKATSDSSSKSKETQPKHDRDASEYFEHFFEKHLSTPQKSGGRNGKLHQGYCKICLPMEDSPNGKRISNFEGYSNFKRHVKTFLALWVIFLIQNECL